MLNLARMHLEKALELTVPDADNPRLLYRLGKVWQLTGVEPQRVIDCLTQSIDRGADDPGEGYALLTRLYLQLSPPNVQAALEANQKYLALSTEGDNRIAAARLLRAELLLRSDDREEARSVLARIGPKAPQEVYAKARWLRALTCQQEQLWQEAAVLWEEILKDRPRDAAEPGRCLYYLGVCYRWLDRTKDAERVWEKALRYDFETAQAAALGLADLRLKSSNPAAALECFERFLKDVTSAERFHNTLVNLKEARALFEAGWQQYFQAADYERAQTLARLYGKIAQPQVSQRLVGQTADAWAHSCLRRSQESGCPNPEHWREQALLHWREAGIAYETGANATSDTSQRLKSLWQSATCYLEGESYAQAVTAFKRDPGLETSPERLGEGWYKISEVYRALNDKEAARAALRKCTEFPGSLAFAPATNWPSRTSSVETSTRRRPPSSKIWT